jgi:hypothetical protein
MSTFSTPKTISFQSKQSKTLSQTGSNKVKLPEVGSKACPSITLPSMVHSNQWCLGFFFSYTLKQGFLFLRKYLFQCKDNFITQSFWLG